MIYDIRAEVRLIWIAIVIAYIRYFLEDNFRKS